jgi:hypothetical protein
MRAALPILLALLIVGCAKPTEAPTTDVPEAGKIVKIDMTPEQMAKAMDIPMYPGSTAPDGLSSAPQKRDDGSTHYSLILATNDPVKVVAAWYAKQTGIEAKADARGVSLVGSTKNGANLILGVKAEAGRTLIDIKAIVYK